MPDQSRLPTFYETSPGITTPYYPHPDIDLHIPRHPLTIQQEKQSLVATNVTPSCIGLSFNPDTYRRSSLRLLASCDNREALLTVLIDLYKSTTTAGFEQSFQIDLIKAMNLREPLQTRLIAEIGPRRVLFDVSCIEWLIAQTLAANPSPWGMPSPTAATKELEQLFFPSLVHRYTPRMCEILRSVFFAHECHLHFDSKLEESPEDFVMATLATSSLREMHITPARALARIARIWNSRRPLGKTHQLLDVFRTQTGVDYQRLVSYVFFLSLADLERVKSATATNAGKFIATFSDSEKSTFNQLLFKHFHIPSSQRHHLIRKEMDKLGYPYRAWGDAPMEAVRIQRRYPIFSLGHSWLIANMGDLVVGLRNLMFEVLTEAGKNAKGLYGDVFETHVKELISKITPRHQLATESEMKRIIGKDKSVPDFLIGFGGNILSVEVYSNIPNENCWRGEIGSIKQQLGEYRRKYRQTGAIIPSIEIIAAECFGWHRVKSVTRLVVTEEMPTFAPLMTKRDDVPICPIRAFEKLIGLACRGWIAPDLVTSWQQESPHLPLGTYLAKQSQITSIAGWQIELDGLSIHRTLGP